MQKRAKHKCQQILASTKWRAERGIWVARDGFRIAEASHLRLWDAWESQKRAAKPPQWGAVQFECAACREAAVGIIDFLLKSLASILSCSMLSLSLLPFALIFY